MWLFRRRNQEVVKPAMAILGLGNPGPAYAHSRHNVGFMCIDHFAEANNIHWKGRKATLVWGEGQIPSDGGQYSILLAKPRTFMNRSGEAVKYLTSRWPLATQELLIIYDDMDIPLGKVRIRPGGSSASHKGIQSIIDALGTQEVPRIRVGIGGLEDEEKDRIGYVLGDFLAEEKQILEGVVATVSEAILCVISDGTDAAMSQFN